MQEQKVWGPLLKKHYKPPQGTYFADSSIEFWSKSPSSHSFSMPTHMMPWDRTLPFSEKVESVSISFFCYSPNAYNVSVSLLDAKGAEVEKLEFNDVTTWDSSDGEKKTSYKFAAPKPSAHTLAIWRRLEEKTPSTLIDPYILDPENHDPLWLGNQEMLEQLSKVQPKSVVACLPDKAQFFFSSEFSFDEYLNDPEEKALKLTEDANWFVFSPEDFADHRSHRNSRKDMAAYAKELRENKNPDIWLYAKLELTGSFLNRAFTHLADPKYSRGDGYGYFRMPFQSAFTQLLVTLTPDQKQRLLGGQVIPYADLKKEQLDLCSQIINGTRVNVETEGDTEPEQLNGQILSGGGIGLEQATEEYICIHNEVTGNRVDPGVFFVGNMKHPIPSFVSGPGYHLPKGGINAARYDLRHMASLTLRCYLKGKNAVVGKFEQPLPVATSTPVPYEQLPSAVQKKLEPVRKYLWRNQ